MFEGALHIVFENAKQLRNTMTDAETVLWMQVRNGISGCKFRRQHPIGPFIADFYCHKAKLVVEIDGTIHKLSEVKQADEDKEDFLVQNGYSLLRFSNKQVMTSIEYILQAITQTISNNICKQSPIVGGQSPL